MDMTLAVKSKENEKINRLILLQCTTLSLYAAETDMTGRRIDGLRMAKKKMFFSHAKAAQALGYSPGPAKQALTDAVQWFQENGYLG